MKHKKPRIYSFVSYLPRNRTQWEFALKLILTAVIFFACAAGFVALADEVVEQETLRFDEAILRTIHLASNPLLNTLVAAVTIFGGPIGVVVLGGVMSGVLLYYRQRMHAVFLAVCVGGAALLNLLLKSLFLRDRPSLWTLIVRETGYSFPSGHAMASMALGLAVVLLAWRTRWRWWTIAAACVYIVLIGVSRMYLGVHYPSDVIAGWLVSTAWVCVVWALVTSPSTKRMFRRSM